MFRHRHICRFVAIVAIASASQVANAGVSIKSISLPVGGVLVDVGTPFLFSVDFETTFLSITDLQISGTFSGELGELWNPGESWYWALEGGGSAGQVYIPFPGALPRSSFSQHTGDPPFTSLLLDGQHNITFSTDGSLRLASLQVQITGTAAPTVPEPGSMIVWSLLGLTITGAGWWRRQKRSA